MIEIKEDYVRSKIKPRPWDAHKGTCGRVLIVAGGTGMAGAAILSARAALRSGAGLVTVACPVYLFHIIQTAVPEATCVNADKLYEMNLNVYDSIAFGPGVGCTWERYRQLEHILLSYRGPVIVDADGINSLCDYGLVPEIEGDEQSRADFEGPGGSAAEVRPVPENEDTLEEGAAEDESVYESEEPFGDVEGHNANADAAGYGAGAYAESYAAEEELFERPSRRMVSILPELVSRRSGPVILTPHPGEADRLLESLGEPRYYELSREEAADILARRTGAIIILKGAGTLVASRGKDNTDIRRNLTGNPGMATGGSGDVLTGVLGALTAYGEATRKYAVRAGREDEIPDVRTEDAARVGVYIHGMAGDIAARETGEIGMTSMDITAALPEAFRQITRR